MTSSDYILDIGLIALVLLQIRGRRVTLLTQLLPIGIVAWAAKSYLHSIPTAGNDLLLIGICAGAGVTLGTLCGILTAVKAGPDGHPFSKAGVAAAVLWVVGVGTRFAFQLYASHGGAASIAHFSASHDITSSQAWVAAIILMALGEAVTRTVVVGARAYAVSPQHFLGSAGDRRPRRAIIGARDRSW
jgi:hypothetical protein